MKLLELARTIEPDFPTSAGRPFRTPDPELLERRHEIASAAHELDAGEATELAARTWRLWMAARDVEGGRRFLAEVLDGGTADRSRWRVLALYGDGLFAYWAGDPEGARRRNEEAFAIAHDLEDEEALLFAHIGQSRVAAEDGDHVSAASHAAAARTLAPQFGEAAGQAPLHMGAQAARLAGDYDTAARFFEESLALNRRIGDEGMLDVDLGNLGVVELRRGNHAAAEHYLAQIEPWPLSEAALALARGEVERARELVAGIDADELPSDDRAELDWLRAQVGG